MIIFCVLLLFLFVTVFSSDTCQNPTPPPKEEKEEEEDKCGNRRFIRTKIQCVVDSLPGKNGIGKSNFGSSIIFQSKRGKTILYDFGNVEQVFSSNLYELGDGVKSQPIRFIEHAFLSYPNFDRSGGIGYVWYKYPDTEIFHHPKITEELNNGIKKRHILNTEDIPDYFKVGYPVFSRDGPTYRYIGVQYGRTKTERWDLIKKNLKPVISKTKDTFENPIIAVINLDRFDSGLDTHTTEHTPENPMLTITDSFQEIIEVVVPTKKIPNNNMNNKLKNMFFIREEEEEEKGKKKKISFVKERFDEELFLMLVEGSKKFLFAGCTRTGIINIMEAGGGNFEAVFFGGVNEEEENLDEYAEKMGKLTNKIYLGHCSVGGENLFLEIQKRLGKDRVSYFGTGDTIEYC